jgi:hypothetical protein
MAIGGWMSGSDLRRDAVVSRRFPQRLFLEFVEHGDRGLVAAAATPAQDGKVRVKPIRRCVANDRSAEVQVDSQTPARVLAERVGLVGERRSFAARTPIL